MSIENENYLCVGECHGYLKLNIASLKYCFTIQSIMKKIKKFRFLWTLEKCVYYIHIYLFIQCTYTLYMVIFILKIICKNTKKMCLEIVAI